MDISNLSHDIYYGTDGESEIFFKCTFCLPVFIELAFSPVKNLEADERGREGGNQNLGKKLKYFVSSSGLLASPFLCVSPLNNNISTY
jgi:hypothetical protein